MSWRVLTYSYGVSKLEFESEKILLTCYLFTRFNICLERQKRISSCLRAVVCSLLSCRRVRLQTCVPADIECPALRHRLLPSEFPYFVRMRTRSGRSLDMTGRIAACNQVGLSNEAKERTHKHAASRHRPTLLDLPDEILASIMKVLDIESRCVRSVKRQPLQHTCGTCKVSLAAPQMYATRQSARCQVRASLIWALAK